MISCDTIVFGGSIITMDSEMRILEEHALAISDGKILDIYPAATQKYQAAEMINAENCLVTPGFINAHTHLSMNYFKGLADDLPLFEWLNAYIWPLEAKMLSPDFVYDAALHGMAEMLLNGITLAQDMYFHVDQVALAALKAGMRVILGSAIIGQHLAGDLSQIQRITTDLLSRFGSENLIKIAVAPHAIYTCDSAVLSECLRVADKYDLRLHIHLSETETEVIACQKEHGLLPAQYLASLGFTQHPATFVHGVWLSETELDTLQNSPASIAICTNSNLKLASGFAPLKALRKRGIPTPLGTDGASSNNALDLLSELGHTARLHKALNQDPEFLPAAEAFSLITSEAARALGLEAQFGSLESGKAADIVIIGLSHPASQPLYDPYSHLVYAIGSRQIRDVLVAGRTVVKDQKLQNLDAAALFHKANYYKSKILAGIK